MAGAVFRNCEVLARKSNFHLVHLNFIEILQKKKLRSGGQASAQILIVPLNSLGRATKKLINCLLLVTHWTFIGFNAVRPIQKLLFRIAFFAILPIFTRMMKNASWIGFKQPLLISIHIYYWWRPYIYWSIMNIKIRHFPYKFIC